MDAYQISVYTTLLIAMVSMLAIISFLLILFSRKQRRQMQIFNKSVAAGEVAREEERERISRDLHDGTGPVLSASLLYLNIAKEKPGNCLEEINKVSKNLRLLNERFRETVHDLVPRQLLVNGLEKTAGDAIARCASLTGMKLFFRYEIKKTLPEETTIHIYRIIQELLENAVKHSGASRIELRLHEEKNFIRIFYEDNGCGFDMKATYQGHGLSNLQHRAVLLEGNMEKSSAPGKGTRYYFEIPIKHN